MIVALIIVKKGLARMRFNLDWKDIELRPDGMMHIQSGKTSNAKRDLPTDSRNLPKLYLRRFEEQGRPEEGWPFQLQRSQATFKSLQSVNSTLPRFRMVA
jgi:hypothetical protein